MKALEYVGLNEGGYVDDPQDQGGPTKYGLTEGLAKRYGIKNIATVTQGDAQRVFILEFWSPKFNQLVNEKLVIKLFDFAIHVGLTKATMLLQLCLRDFGFDHVDADGKIGPVTVNAANALDQGELVKRFCQRQEQYYRGRAEKRPENMKYVVAKNGGDGGWITRAKRIPV